MFVRNKTPFKVALAHGSVTETGSAAALVVATTYRVTQGALVPCEAPAPLPTDPPDLGRRTFWIGSSVTAAGNVYGPTSAPFQKIVSLTVGDIVRRLLVSGDRHWTPGLTGNLEPSSPARFECLALSFTRAFGGQILIPPGLFPGTDLPYPGGRLAYPLNGGGVGFYLDMAAATGRALPSFELADQPVRQWSDRPTPGCFVPCPDLVGLRVAPPRSVKSIADWEGNTLAGVIRMSHRTLHHAPGYLVFDELRPGTPIHLEGVGYETIRFEVPKLPVRVRVRRGDGPSVTRGRVWSVHVDADRAVVSCVHGYPFVYPDGDAPDWVLVEA